MSIEQATESYSKLKKELQERITADMLLQFQAEAFACMASSFGRNGSAKLGVNAFGEFVVKAKTETFTFTSPADAVKKYIDVVTE